MSDAGATLLVVGADVGPSGTDFDLTAVRAYIGEVRWKYAKTMPQWPHEYTVKDWRPDLAERFEAFCRVILDGGFVEPWPPPPARAIHHNHYLVVGEHKYWAMGPLGDADAIEDKTVINRARYPDSRVTGSTAPTA